MCCLFLSKNGSENSEILPETGPQKPLTSFMLFYKALSKDAQDTKNKKPKEPYKVVWENMSPIDKVVWINWAAEEVKKYQVICLFKKKSRFIFYYLICTH